MGVCLDLLQLHTYGTIDPACSFKWRSLKKMTDKEKAELNNLKADRDTKQLANGGISQEEIRDRMSKDPNSDYYGVDPDDLPPAPAPQGGAFGGF